MNRKTGPKHRKEPPSPSRRALLYTPALGITGLAVLLAADANSSEREPVRAASVTQPHDYYALDMPPKRRVIPQRISRGIEAARHPMMLSKRQQIIATAQALFGIPYVWGGTSRRGFDCSGLVQWVYREAAGIILPRVADDQANTLTRVTNPLPGDLVCFSGGYVHHIGIYVGPGQMIDAPHAGSTVGRHDIWGSPWFGRHPALSA